MAGSMWDAFKQAASDSAQPGIGESVRAAKRSKPKSEIRLPRDEQPAQQQGYDDVRQKSRESKKAKRAVRPVSTQSKVSAKPVDPATEAAIRRMNELRKQRDNAEYDIPVSKMTAKPGAPPPGSVRTGGSDWHTEEGGIVSSGIPSRRPESWRDHPRHYDG